MGCPAVSGATALYRPRRPQASPLWRLLSRYFDEFQRIYDERYQKHYGFWRPVIATTVEKFLACGDLREGFARVRCPRCRHEFFVAFSCRRRCLCPSCHQKRALIMADHIARDLCSPVAHRQFVFTIPKRLRIFFRFDRRLLGALPRLAWQTVLEVYRTVLDRRDVTPGMIGAIHTFGELVHFHPHLHALVTDGAFATDGTFIALPGVDDEPFETLWQKKVFDLLLKENKIDPSVVTQMRGWNHSGFGVHHAVRLDADDGAGRERLAQYMLRCPVSLDRIIRVTEQGTVIYLAEKKACRHFPKPASDDLFSGVSPGVSPGVARNFQVFDALDFIAELTQHIPDPRTHLVRYFGFYSNKSRGMRARADGDATHDTQAARAPSASQARRRWAALIKRVWQVDPLQCPRCGSTMKIISFIEPTQPDVIDALLTHCGLADEPARAPPHAPPPAFRELQYVSDLDFVQEPAPTEPVWSPD